MQPTPRLPFHDPLDSLHRARLLDEDSIEFTRTGEDEISEFAPRPACGLWEENASGGWK